MVPSEAELLEWLSQQERSASPQEVRIVGLYISILELGLSMTEKCQCSSM